MKLCGVFAGAAAALTPDGRRGSRRAPPLLRTGEKRTGRAHAVDCHYCGHGHPRYHHWKVPHVNGLAEPAVIRHHLTDTAVTPLPTHPSRTRQLDDFYWCYLKFHLCRICFLSAYYLNCSDIVLAFCDSKLDVNNLQSSITGKIYITLTFSLKINNISCWIVNVFVKFCFHLLNPYIHIHI